MANTFSFQIGESFLTAYADYLKHIREQNPGKSYTVTISVDLIPDGAGYEIRGAPQISIDEVAEEGHSKAIKDQEITTSEQANEVAVERYNREMDKRNSIIRASVDKPWLPLHDGE